MPACFASFRSRRIPRILALCTLLAALVLKAKAQDLSHAALFAPNTSFPYFASCGQVDTPEPDAFSLSIAAQLAQCSLLIYVKEDAFIQERLAEAGFSDSQTFDQLGTYAFLAENEGNLIIAFRGTETGDQTDYLTDAKFNQTSFTEHGTAHSGFVEALAQVSSDLRQSIDERLQENPGKRVWITGHSMGGALATLFAIEHPDLVTAVYTFGAPRAVGRQLAGHCQASLPLFRIVNNNDLVPRLPSPPFYEHIGSTYFLTAERNLIIDPAGLETWTERAKGHSEFLKRLVSEHWMRKDFSAIPSAYFVDHSPRLYAELLIELAEQGTAE